MGKNTVYFANNLDVLQALPDESVDLVYIDPPFNTGTKKQRRIFKASQPGDTHLGTTGFGGNKYILDKISDSMSYDDAYHDGFLQFLKFRMVELHRILKKSGTLYLHLDYREAPYARLLGDSIFGRENFLNEIIWAYDFGAKPKTRWPAKHDNIMMWVKEKGSHVFNVDDIIRIPYMAPGLVGKEKAARGKLPTDVFWHTIVPTNGKEKTGYPTQKPLGLIERLVTASSPPDGVVLDCFAGSGTTGEAALKLGRNFILMDENPQAIKVMRDRFKPYRKDGIKIRFVNRMPKTE